MPSRGALGVELDASTLSAPAIVYSSRSGSRNQRTDLSFGETGLEKLAQLFHQSCPASYRVEAQHAVRSFIAAVVHRTECDWEMAP
jgi:hypothetical protein